MQLISEKTETICNFYTCEFRGLGLWLPSRLLASEMRLVSRHTAQWKPSPTEKSFRGQTARLTWLASLILKQLPQADPSEHSMAYLYLEATPLLINFLVLPEPRCDLATDRASLHGATPHSSLDP